MSRQLASTRLGFVQRYWRGEVSLLLTIVFFLLALRAVLVLLQSSFLQAESLGSTSLWLFLGLLLLLWQILGACRAVDHNMSYSGDMVAVYLCYISMALVLVVSLVQVGDALSALKPTVASASAVEPTPPLLRVEGRRVLLSGDIDFAANTELRATLEHHKNIDTLLLDSEGGRVFAARALALTIEQYQLDTHVDQRCHSACTLAFIAGAKRSLSAGAQLGFHRYRHNIKQAGIALSVDEQLRKDQQLFLLRGVDARFVDKMFSHSNEQLWRPSRSELLQAGVVNTPP